MPRAKNTVASHRRKKKIFKAAKGYRGGKSKLLRTAKDSVEKSLQYSYRDRRVRRREIRKLWITRINAAVRPLGFSYSKFINHLKTNKIRLNRKVLADIAVKDPETFEKIVKDVQA
ncbi:MAG: 50S ribosomal protein L20 [bacterium]